MSSPKIQSQAELDQLLSLTGNREGLATKFRIKSRLEREANGDKGHRQVQED